MDYKAFYARQIEYYKHDIEWATESIKSENDRIKRIRKDDKECIERVWSSGVVTAAEMRTFHKDFKSKELRNALSWRNWLYRSRRKSIASLKKYEALLAE